MSQPEITEYKPVSEPRVVHVTCYVAACTACGWRAWVFSGYVLYWVADHSYKGGAGYSPGSTYCKPCVGDEYFARGPGTMHPVSFAEQEAYHAMHRVGGDAAIEAALLAENKVR